MNFDEATETVISTQKGDSLFVEVEGAGEYANFYQLQINREANEFIFHLAKRLWTPDYDDKLSAHKVNSQKIIVILPEAMHLRMISKQSHVNVSGKFANLQLILGYGHASLISFFGNATVQTYSGNIRLDTNLAQIEVDASPENVQREAIVTGPNKIRLKTASGKISIHKSH
ncbi:MAG: hypothetical protein RQ735_06195 [Flavobacteriaceae bacterium]|nr:hypothetical protein [Flavobacteriaceae bacterium]